ncbi:MAG: hypothetical protein ACI9K5_004206, partial [Gammaproteobacteria bacterium]
KLPGKASGSPRSCTYTGGSDNAARRVVGPSEELLFFNGLLGASFRSCFISAEAETQDSGP